jgi:hypothetical protein
MCGQLDFEVIPKNERRPFNFHEFWNEGILYKKLPSKKCFMFECCGSHRTRACNFLRFMSKKVTFRFYNYSPKFTCFDFLGKSVSPTMSNIA